jgi:hypothetical protein
MSAIAPGRAALKAKRSAAYVTSVDDMPEYPREMHAIVEAMLAELKPGSLLMTYRAIREQFGISRATVARRLKDGVVPGITLCDGHVLDDGAVRRFDRTQLRWLLLAVRFAHRRLHSGQRNAAAP